MTMWLAMTWWGCGSGQPALPEGPDPAVTKVAVDNLCKLYEGARLTCERQEGAVVAEGTRIGVAAEYDQLEERVGISTFRGTVTLSTPEHTWITRMGGYGSRTEEAVERGLHEWALTEGTAFVDAVRGDTQRAALKAVEPTLTPAALSLGGRPVYRGWTLMRPPLEGGIPHDELLAAIAGKLSLDGGPHVLRFEVARALEEMSYTCYLDGQPSDALCAAVRSWSWPEVRSYEVRQTYVVPPS
jgi:hypothetical protein